jgi:Mce-associated membrane protein
VSRAAVPKYAALVLAAVLVVALAVTVGVLARSVQAGSRRQAAAAAATRAARTGVPVVLSYSYTSLGTDLARAQTRLTGDFGQQYQQVAASVVAPTATKNHVTTTATLAGSSVLSASGSTVRLLLFVDQSTKSTDKADVINTSRLEATLRRVGHAWLISDLKAI